MITTGNFMGWEEFILVILAAMILAWIIIKLSKPKKNKFLPKYIDAHNEAIFYKRKLDEALDIIVQLKKVITEVQEK